MPKVLWKAGVRKNREERKGVESVQKMVTRHKLARKSYKERVEAVLMNKSSVKRLQKGCVYTRRERECREMSLAA